MQRFLLVAYQTAESEELLWAARALQDEDSSAEFTLLVPATPVKHLLVWEEGETLEVARLRANSAAERLEREGLRVSRTVVGDQDPVLAIGDEIRQHRYSAIVVSTLPAGYSRWLKMDVLSRLQRAFPRLRVIHVAATESVAVSEVDAGPGTR